MTKTFCAELKVVMISVGKDVLGLLVELETMSQWTNPKIFGAPRQSSQSRGLNLPKYTHCQLVFK